MRSVASNTVSAQYAPNIERVSKTSVQAESIGAPSVNEIVFNICAILFEFYSMS
jgi:hypothetical protein